MEGRVTAVDGDTDIGDWNTNILLVGLGAKIVVLFIIMAASHVVSMLKDSLLSELSLKNRRIRQKTLLAVRLVDHMLVF